MKRNIYKKSIVVALSTVCLSSVALGNISGIVYTDFNLNGQKDSNDILLKEVAVHAVCEDGNSYNTVTNANGQYTIEGFPSGEYCRIEANPSTQGLDSASNSAGSAPLVDRVADGTTDHDISVASSGTYCQENPDVIAVALPTEVSGSTEYHPDNYPTLIKTVHPAADGTINDQETIDSTRETLATFSDTGSTWGLAYKKDTKDTFMATTLKPYANLGTYGIGAIYKISQDNTITHFTTITNASSENLNIYLGNRNVTFNDSSIYQYIAREGLGDIDISEDYQTLYVLNIYEKSVIEINANTGDFIKKTVLPNPYHLACPDDDVRPWALAVKGNDVYIGSVCESKISGTNRVGASIQKYNGSIVQEIARTNTLEYLKPRYKDPISEALGDYDYKSWSENMTAPILTDIEFSTNGDLILGYTNRASFIRHGQVDALTILGGDIRKMCKNSDGTFTDESTAEAPTLCDSHEVIYSGNSEKYYEFYIGDFLGDVYGETGHPETMSGSLVQQAGKQYITASIIDGTAFEAPGAIAQLSHLTGERIGVQALLKSEAKDEGEALVFGRKAGGLGDIELMCDPAPIEIGNYIWADSDKDGIQDPEELPIVGVAVLLYDGNTLIGTATTDATGHYYFGGLTDTNLNTGVHLTSFHNYTIKVDRNQDSITEATVKDVNSNADDIHDSDARTEASYLVIDVTTNTNNNHTLDIGIIPYVKIGNFVWIEDDNDGDATTGTITPVAGTTVTATCDSVLYTTTTDSTGKYEISVPANVNCTCVKVSTPSGTVPATGSSDNSVTDTTSEENKTHDGTCTSVAVGTIDNMTLDFGFYDAADIFDLALIKTINTSATPGPYRLGDNVTFSIKVINQGTIDATDVQVNDYVPQGLSLNDSAWVRPGITATLKNTIPLIRAGESKTVNITLKIDTNFQGTSITNNAEIRYASGGSDIDSIPDNENGSVVDPQDNDTANTTGGDDYDLAILTISTSNPTPTPKPTSTPTPTPKPTSTPSKPTELNSYVDGTSIVMTWKDTSNETGYEIYKDNVLIKVLGANVTSYTLSDLDTNTHTYSIRAINSQGKSALTSIVVNGGDTFGWLIPIYHIILN